MLPHFTRPLFKSCSALEHFEKSQTMFWDQWHIFIVFGYRGESSVLATRGGAGSSKLCRDMEKKHFLALLLKAFRSEDRSTARNQNLKKTNIVNLRKNMWNIGCFEGMFNWATNKKPSYFALYWLADRDPYNCFWNNPFITGYKKIPYITQPTRGPFFIAQLLFWTNHGNLKRTPKATPPKK